MNLTMTCLQIVGLKTDLQIAVQTLRCLGCMDIDELDTIPELPVGPLILDAEIVRRQESLTTLLAQVEGLVEAMRKPQAPREAPQHPPSAQDDLDTICTEVGVLAPKIQGLIARREKLNAELDSLPRYEATLRRLLPVMPRAALDPDHILIGVLVSRAHIKVFDVLEKHVLSLTGGRAEILNTDIDASTRAMLLVFPREYARQIEELLGQEDISRLRLPTELGEGPPDAALAALHRRLAAIPEEINQLNRELSELAAECYTRLINWRIILRDELTSYNVLSRFGETDTTFVLVGWVPAQDADKVKTALCQATCDRVLVQELPLTHERKKRAPVALQNPPIARPFESLVKLLSLPQYGTTDPTRLMALFLPIFFGMMLGDIGYGALLLAICLGLLRRFRDGMIRNLLLVLAIGSAWGVLFGFLFGELFGTLGEQIGLHAIWMDRTSPEHVTGLLLTTVAIGAVHITLGLVLGVWEAIRDRSRNHLLERGGMLLGLMGLFLLVGILVDFLPRGLMTPAIAGVIVGIVLLGAPLGWLGILLGPIEFIGLIGNVLSYLRIAAIGLASVYLARVANDMAGMVGNIIVGVVLAVLIHALNLVMGGFSPMIHSLRLHYVEFFRKFYEGGGRPYEPFRSQLGSEL